jgi:hypothetical protein
MVTETHSGLEEKVTEKKWEDELREYKYNERENKIILDVLLRANLLNKTSFAEQVTQIMLDNIGRFENAMIHEIVETEHGKALKLLSAKGNYTNEYLERVSCISDKTRSLLWYSVNTKAPVFSENIDENPEIREIIGDAGVKLGTKSVICFPIECPGSGEIEGTLGFNGLKPFAYTKEDFSLVNSVVGILGSFFCNLQLSDKVHDLENEVRSLKEQIKRIPGSNEWV